MSLKIRIFYSEDWLRTKMYYNIDDFSYLTVNFPYICMTSNSHRRPMTSLTDASNEDTVRTGFWSNDGEAKKHIPDEWFL